MDWRGLAWFVEYGPVEAALELAVIRVADINKGFSPA